MARSCLPVQWGGPVGNLVYRFDGTLGRADRGHGEDEENRAQHDVIQDLIIGNRLPPSIYSSLGARTARITFHTSSREQETVLFGARPLDRTYCWWRYARDAERP